VVGVRILVTGSREWDNWRAVYWTLSSLQSACPGQRITLVHGGARGADAIAEQAAQYLGWAIERHEADWDANGKAAGAIRNQAMADAGADLCVAFVRPCSLTRCKRPGATRPRRPGAHITHGTADCIKRAKSAGIPVREIEG
jgi:SLOG family YspA-like protein